VYLTGVHLTGMHLRGAHLTRACVSGGVHFIEVHLINMPLSRADLAGVSNGRASPADMHLTGSISTVVYALQGWVLETRIFKNSF
jgi:hypothetical protein